MLLTESDRIDRMHPDKIGDSLESILTIPTLMETYRDKMLAGKRLRTLSQEMVS